MNIYFSCSITGGREYEPVYQAITRLLLADGHEVPTAHLADPSVKDLEKKVRPRQVYERDVAWIEACDGIIAEVSTPSHGVGYEIALALNIGKPVLCLYQEGVAVSKMLTGNTHPNLKIKSYQDLEDALAAVRDFVSLPSVDL